VVCGGAWNLLPDKLLLPVLQIGHGDQWCEIDFVLWPSSFGRESRVNPYNLSAGLVILLIAIALG